LSQPSKKKHNPNKGKQKEDNLKRLHGVQKPWVGGMILSTTAQTGGKRVQEKRRKGDGGQASFKAKTNNDRRGFGGGDAKLKKIKKSREKQFPKQMGGRKKLCLEKIEETKGKAGGKGI